MAFHLVANWDKPIEQTRSFLCDTASDIESLPDNETRSDEYPNGVPIGSDALCTNDGSYWILSASNEWTQVNLGSGGGSGGGGSLDIDIATYEDVMEILTSSYSSLPGDDEPGGLR